MLNLQKVKSDYCKTRIQEAYQRTYSDMEKGLGNIITWTAHLALENIANSDALYHDAEHTIMVTLAGQSILEGKHLSEGGVSPGDWAQFMIALLCHDIGYVKGICADDNGYQLATGKGKKTIQFPEGTTDAQLAPYHIDRSKRFVLERFGKKMLRESGGLVDAKLIASYIEMTRFPVPDGDRYKDTSGFPGLVRAADFIGQLADPNRLQKCTALFYEFEELGLNEKLGYKTPGDLRKCNAKFYWDIVSPYVQEALGYLKVTHEGKQWIANLQSNVFGNNLFADGPREMPEYPELNHKNISQK
jgi:hypothetical protein